MNPLIWNCVSNTPTKWALGIQAGDKLNDVCAEVTRCTNGEWLWELYPWNTRWGVEPSQEAAMERAEKEMA